MYLDPATVGRTVLSASDDAAPPLTKSFPPGRRRYRLYAIGDALTGGLLAAAQRGDGAAYAAFLRAILPFVRAVARRRCWSEDMAEDAAGGALLTIHRVRHTYEPGRSVKP